jgi:hypothetical protein
LSPSNAASVMAILVSAIEAFEAIAETLPLGGRRL